MTYHNVYLFLFYLFISLNKRITYFFRNLFHAKWMLCLKTNYCELNEVVIFFLFSLTCKLIKLYKHIHTILSHRILRKKINLNSFTQVIILII